MRAEDLHEWLHEARHDENPDFTRWLALITKTVQEIFRTGIVPKEVFWSVLVCIPKPGGGARGIGLLKVIWKLCEAIIDTRVKQSVTLHDSIHGFTDHCGTGTAIIKAKLQQELAHIQNRPLFQVFLDLKKAYNTLDRPRLLRTYQDYGMGPKLRNVLQSLLKCSKRWYKR
jgi:Reverse transcriptase (RNA-dependent DNA polymerase)